MDTNFDAIVIGAGPAGSTIAILLARSGWRVACVEKMTFPRRKVCGECISASNLPLLDALGIGKDVLRLAGPPLHQVALLVRDRMIRADLPRYPDRDHRWGIALGREHLDTMLLEQAVRCGVALFQPWIARAVHGEPGNFSCSIRRMHAKADSLVLAAPVVIDAHGSWEPAPTRPRQVFPRCDADLFAFKTNFASARLEPGLLPLLSFPGGYGGMVIGDHATATFAFCIRRDTLAACQEQAPGLKPAEAASAHVMRHCTGVHGLLGAAREQGMWLSVGPIRPGVRIRPCGNRAFLIGNAAGEAHPIIGEGISIAIQSAWLLADLLAAHRSALHDQRLHSRLQLEYARAWRRHFATRIGLSSLFAQAAMRPSLVAAVLPLLVHCPQLLGHFAQWSGKVRAAPHRQGSRA